MRISDWSSDVCSSDLIAFNRGTFAPETAEGDHLIAHELAHTTDSAGKSTVRRFEFTDILDYHPFNPVGVFNPLNAFGLPIGGFIQDPLETLACAEASGRSVYDVMSGKGFSLDRFLGIKQPAEGTAGTRTPRLNSSH